MNFEAERKALVESMKNSRVLKSREIEKAFLEIPREFFVREDLRTAAYADDALPLILGQTISQPSTIAAMLENLKAGKGMKVLEVGSGSGFVLALLSKIVGNEGKVFGIELLPELAEASKINLEKAGIENVEVFCADGSKGLESKKPFDRILISAACGFVPKALIEQLNEGGIIVAPVGDAFTQQIEILQKFNGKIVKNYAQGLYVFVPLKTKN